MFTRFSNQPNLVDDIGVGLIAGCIKCRVFTLKDKQA